jgi:hypothetical protein
LKEAAVAYFSFDRDYYSEMKPVIQSHCLSSVRIRTGYLANTKQPRSRREARNITRHFYSHSFGNGIGRTEVLWKLCGQHTHKPAINLQKKPQLTCRVIGNSTQWNRIVAGEFRGVSCVTSLHQSVAHLRERGKPCREESKIKLPQCFLVAGHQSSSHLWWQAQEFRQERTS